MVTRGLILILLTLPLVAADSAAALGSQLRQLALDPEACYRVRDLPFDREDASIHFTDGFLIFAKPIAGRRIAAVFSGNEPGDDAEMLLRPPNRSERAALAAATGSPNLNEHFRSAVFLFTDGSGDELLKQILAGVPKPNAEMGSLLAGLTSETVRNLCESFQVRLVLDLLADDRADGVFYAAFSGQKLGNFDLLHDPTLPEQIILGQVSDKHIGGFNVWASFPARSFRQSRRTLVVEDASIENYRIEAQLQPDLTLNVTTRVTAKVRDRLAGALAFELAPEMEVSAVRIDGQPVEVFRRESLRSKLIGNRANDPFLIVLPKPFMPGTSHEIEFNHSGKVIRPAGNNVFFVAARTNWYPTRGNYFSKFDVTFRVPKELSVVATGDIAEETVEGDWRVSRRRTSAPVRMAGFNVGVYEHMDTTRDGFLVQVYANRSVEPSLQSHPRQVVMPPSGSIARGGIPSRTGEVVTVTPAAPDPRIRLTALAAEITSSLEWMSSHFGPPPLRTLTASPIPGNFGQGFPGLLYLSTITFLNEKERPAALQTPTNFTFYSEILHAHETAHQWWGNLVTSATYHDDWLQEALANYSALMILERKKGPKAVETALDEYRNELRLNLPESKKTAESAGPITWGMRLHTISGVDPWRVITYGKGSWIMHMLRRRMGDTAFLAMLGEVRKRYAYVPINNEQFREIAAEFSPKGLPDPDLENFFDNWVYGTGVPTLEISSKTKGKAPNVDLEVTVRQTNADDEFGIDIPVEIRLPGQVKPITQWIRTGPEPASFHVKLRVAPAKVELAPGAGVLAQRK